jgi:predicted membrane protein
MNTPASPNSTRSRSGKILAGTLLLIVGIILLLERLGYLFPHWFFSWPVFLIVLGLFIGFRHNFRNPAWFVLITVGGVFLAERLMPELNVRHLLWPIIIILLGLWMIFGRHRRPRYYSPNRQVTDYPDDFQAGPIPMMDDPSPYNATSPNPESYSPGDYEREAPVTSDDYLNATAVLGGVKRIVVSKNFQGGEITTFMGGSEINLGQADIQGRVILDVTQVMGGTRLIVPAHWNVISEMSAILGGIEDKRFLQPGTLNPNKVLLIKGTSIMGGIDIRSY